MRCDFTILLIELKYHDFDAPMICDYCNNPNNWDRHARAKSVDPEQSDLLQKEQSDRVYTVYHSV